MKLVLAHICYLLGDFVSRLLYWDSLAFLYPVYNKLMLWSSDLDTNGVIWKKPNE
jgi:hypothetical protein